MKPFEHPHLGPLHLGRKPPDPKRMKLMLDWYLRIALPDPIGGTWSDEVTVPWPMMLNDDKGDCVAANVGHIIMAMTAASRTIVIPTDAQVLAFYASQNPNGQDNGMVEADAMEYWRTTGMAGHKIDAYADVSPQNPRFMQQANDLLGPITLGVGLPINCQAAIKEGGVWDVIGDGKTGDSAPESWGGHAVPFMGYESVNPTPTSTIEIATWGMKMYMTWRFFLAYCEEAHAALSKDWTNAQGLAPSDVDYSSLTAALNAVRAS